MWCGGGVVFLTDINTTLGLIRLTQVVAIIVPLQSNLHKSDKLKTQTKKAHHYRARLKTLQTSVYFGLSIVISCFFSCPLYSSGLEQGAKCQKPSAKWATFSIEKIYRVCFTVPLYISISGLCIVCVPQVQVNNLQQAHFSLT